MSYLQLAADFVYVYNIYISVHLHGCHGFSTAIICFVYYTSSLESVHDLKLS